MPTYYATSDTTWSHWSTGTSSTATSSTASTEWIAWNQTSSTTTTGQTWEAWITDSRGRRYRVTPGATVRVDNVWYSWNEQVNYRPSVSRPVPPPTAEELAAAKEARRQAEERAKEERALRVAAEARAEELLLELLDAEQRAEYAERQQFHVIAPSGKRYCIKKGVAGNIRMDDRRYCAHAVQNLPTADHMLSQKLALETDEAAFLAVANVSVVR